MCLAGRLTWKNLTVAGAMPPRASIRCRPWKKTDPPSSWKTPVASALRKFWRRWCRASSNSCRGFIQSAGRRLNISEGRRPPTDSM